MLAETGANRRILVIDDNQAIHEDFRKILCAELGDAVALAESETALFGEADEPAMPVAFELDFASQGQEGVAFVRRARMAGEPYALAFVDARMPPGWDGIETIARIWEEDPNVQIVICTAYSDYSWQQIRKKLVHTDRLVILKKPFDTIEVLQLADALTQRWSLARTDRSRLDDLQQRIDERNRDLQAIESINAQLDASNKRLTTVASSDRASRSQIERRRLVAEELRHALEKRQLTVHYQPLVDIASRRVVSLEALLRWQHPQLGSVSPGEFIPVAEKTGLIVPIGEFVLRTVCEQSVRWERADVPVVRVAVNLSAVQLEHRPLWEFVHATLRETGMPPERLALELTESVVIKNARHHAQALQRLRNDGVCIQMDDFGTGYSSLSCLKELPIDTLKIDRSFVSQLATSSTDEAIVSAILTMARSLRLRVVAEGVETPAQLEVLGRHGCEFAQGFYFCRPLPADQCRELLVDLAERSSFTDTLRMRITTSSAGPRLAIVGDRKTRKGDA
jgi:EAL domain-containing protein (putative c-di-GMP-specific phosphodiesterase class I)/CheY-like chemotaxis protein